MGDAVFVEEENLAVGFGVVLKVMVEVLGFVELTWC